MQDSPPQKKSFRSRVIAPVLLVALAFLLSACVKDNVVVEPVSVQKVPRALMQPIKPPSCDLDDKAKDYSTDEVGSSLNCWKAAFEAAQEKHAGLSKAVARREAAIEKAVKAKK